MSGKTSLIYFSNVSISKAFLIVSKPILINFSGEVGLRSTLVGDLTAGTRYFGVILLLCRRKNFGDPFAWDLRTPSLTS